MKAQELTLLHHRSCKGCMITVQERDKDIAQGSYGIRQAKNAFKAAAARLQLGVSRAAPSREAAEAQAEAAAWARVQVRLVQLCMWIGRSC